MVTDSYCSVWLLNIHGLSRKITSLIFPLWRMVLLCIVNLMKALLRGNIRVDVTLHFCQELMEKKMVFIFLTIISTDTSLVDGWSFRITSLFSCWKMDLRISSRIRGVCKVSAGVMPFKYPLKIHHEVSYSPILPETRNICHTSSNQLSHPSTAFSNSLFRLQRIGTFVTTLLSTLYTGM